MPQIINTNIASLNSQRNLDRSQTQLGVALQRLSSGLRINSAKDDAAGLAISERFTTQIRGINQAIRNSNDGISLAQTAEGDLAQVTNNLQRIRELAVQSANATNSASDRAALQLEASQLISEIDRVASTSAFNGVRLLDGTFSSQQFQVGANSGETVTIANISSARTNDIGTTFGATLNVTSPTDVSANFANGDLTINGSAVNATADAAAIAAAISAIDPNLSATVQNVQTVNFTDVTGNPTELTAGAGATPGVTTFQNAITNFDFAGGDSASFVVDATTVTLNQNYGNIAGVVNAIQNQLGGTYSVSESAGVVSIATTATGAAISAPAVNTFNGNADGGDADGVVTDFVTGTVTTNGVDVVTATVDLGAFTAGVDTNNDFTFSLTFDTGDVGESLVVGGNITGTNAFGATELAAEFVTAGFTANGGGTVNGFTLDVNGNGTIAAAITANQLTVQRADGDNFTSVQASANFGTTAADFAAIPAASVDGVEAVAEVFTANTPSTVFDFSVDSVSFDVSDGTNSTTITLNANYTNLAGVVGAINTQITADGSPADVTASLDGFNNLVFTSNTPSSVTISTSAYNGNVDGNIGTQTDFVGTPTTLAGTNGASYNLSVNGIALDFSSAGANGTITTAEVAALVNAIDGLSVSNILGASFDITSADGSNIVLVESGAESASEGIAGDGSTTPVTTTLRGQITSITNASGALVIAGNNPTNAGTGISPQTIAVDTTTALGTTISNTDISTVSGANAALQSVDAALTTVNSNRASLGAIQNRFESVVASLSTSSENLSAARSRIRDADFAQETAALTRTQILQQAGVSILSQANALPQLVLSLLQ